MSTSSVRVGVIGAGSWGTALAAASARHNPTCLWARQPEAVAALQQYHENRSYLPGIPLPESLQYTSDLSQAVEFVLQPGAAAVLILGVPVVGLQATCEALVQQLPTDAGPLSVVWTCKGLDADTGRLPHQIAGPILQTHPHIAWGVLSGPSFAKEVAQGLPVALTVASASDALRQALTAALHQGNIRVYGSTDLIGVEVGGAVKNIIALATGICDGLGLGDNARAALVTRGLAEMTRFGVALGARAETFSGLTGLGDLILTTTGDLSRNRQVGLAIGRGQTLEQVLAGMSQVAEGARCVQAVRSLARKLAIDMPITDAVCAILFEGVPPSTVVHQLLTRDPRTEG